MEKPVYTSTPQLRGVEVSPAEVLTPEPVWTVQPKHPQVPILHLVPGKESARLTEMRGQGRGLHVRDPANLPDPGPSAASCTHFSEGPAQHGPRALPATTGRK